MHCRSDERRDDSSDGGRRPRKDPTMSPRPNQTVQMGDLIAATFDAAAQLGGDTHETARLATRALAHMLEVRSHVRTGRADRA